MMEKPQQKLWPDLVAPQNIDHFRESLDAATEDGKYKILAQLFSSELEELKKRQRR